MRSQAVRILIAALFVSPAAAFASDELRSAAEIYESCAACHGEHLMGNASTGAPRLSGMEGWYVENQLHAFRKGWRGQHGNDAAAADEQSIVTALTDAQIREAAQLVAGSQSDPPPATIDGDAENGKRLYSTCATCHGIAAEGNIALGSPALTGLNDWYLVTQISRFKDGTRGGKPGDIYGMQMRASAGLLPDDQAINDVVSYILTLDNQ